MDALIIWVGASIVNNKSYRSVLARPPKIVVVDEVASAPQVDLFAFASERRKGPTRRNVIVINVVHYRPVAGGIQVAVGIDRVAPVTNRVITIDNLPSILTVQRALGIAPVVEGRILVVVK